MDFTEDENYSQIDPILTDDFLFTTYCNLFQTSEDNLNEFIPNYEKIDYSFLLFIILGLTKQYHLQIKFQDLSPAQYRILIKKDVPKSIVALFKRIFDELTLEKIQISENSSNEWVFNFSF